MVKLLGWLSVILLVTAGCGSESAPARKSAPARADDAGPPVKLAAGPGAFASDFTSSPDFFTRMSRLEKGRADSPHNIVRIYYSTNIEPVVDERAFTVPVGTVAIKQQDRDADGKIDNVLGMIKQPAGFDSENGDWLYEQRAPGGTLQDSGKTPFCIGCHKGFATTDYLAGTMLHDVDAGRM